MFEVLGRGSGSMNAIIRLGRGRATTACAASRSSLKRPAMPSSASLQQHLLLRRRIPSSSSRRPLSTTLPPSSSASESQASSKSNLSSGDVPGQSLPFVFLHIGNLCALTSFAMYDVLHLRTLAFLATVCGAFLATVCGVTYNVTVRPPLMQSAYWGIIFAAVNGAMIIKLLLEEQEIAFSKDEMAIFEEHFLPYGLPPTCFLKLMQRSEWKVISAGKVIVKEGEPLSDLILIADGQVDAFVNGIPISSFAFPGDGSSQTGGAWIGDTNFLVIGENVAPALATFVAKTPTNYLLWNYEELRQLMREDPRLAKAFTSAIMGAMVGKILALTSQEACNKEAAYREIMETVLVDRRVDPAEKKYIREYRSKHGITEEMHRETLKALAWTIDEYEDGSKYTEDLEEEHKGVIMRVNQGLMKKRSSACEPVEGGSKGGGKEAGQ